MLYRLSSVFSKHSAILSRVSFNISANSWAMISCLCFKSLIWLSLDAMVASYSARTRASSSSLSSRACCSSSVLFSSVPILSRCFSCMALNCRDMSAMMSSVFSRCCSIATPNASRRSRHSRSCSRAYCISCAATSSWRCKEKISASDRLRLSLASNSAGSKASFFLPFLAPIVPGHLTNPRRPQTYVRFQNTRIFEVHRMN
mmetsp:Transcript_34172/g.65282  ORF Transcript_34172/g.65282 Transcript_34172/m.65282 type:complete len:202 (+) Transcript_34172:213-818(+)